MDGTVTVSVKSILLAGLVLLALVVAYLLGSQGQAAAPANAAEEPGAGDPRTLVMVGTGEATAVPDQLSFSMSASAQRVDLEEALAVTNATMARALRTLEEYGVGEDDVKTTGLSMYPVFDYHDYAPPTIVGYRVSQRAHVTVEKMGRGGKAITAVVGGGDNAIRVGSIRLEIGDPEAVIEKARDAAVEEATTKAEQYAGATGQELGAVLRLQEVSGTAAREPYAFQRVAYVAQLSSDTSVPIQAGSDELKVRVQVVWELAG